MRLCLFQPDIPQNTGTILRLAACLHLGVDIIEPCGFAFSHAKFRRAGMDYIDALDIERHASWADFKQSGAERGSEKESRRLILLTTKAASSYLDFTFEPSDVLILGQESSGVPEDVHQDVDARLKIPIQAGQRSLNVAMAAAMVSGEALRQLGGQLGGQPGDQLGELG